MATEKTTPADPPLPAITLPDDDREWLPVLMRGVVSDISERQPLTIAHVANLLDALPEETRDELLTPWIVSAANAWPLHDLACKERDALAAKLEKAMAVVEPLLEVIRCEFCPLCDELAHADEHDADCPLVAQGFIDRDGRRLETAGKEGA